MIERLSRSDDQTVRVDRADLDEFVAAAFEACNVLAETADHLAFQAHVDPIAAVWERLSKWCSDE